MSNPTLVAMFLTTSLLAHGQTFAPVGTVHGHHTSDGDFDLVYERYPASVRVPWEARITSHLKHAWSSPEFDIQLIGTDIDGSEGIRNIHVVALCKLMPSSTCTLMKFMDGPSFQIRDVKASLTGGIRILTEDERMAENKRAAAESQKKSEEERAASIVRRARDLEEAKQRVAACHRIYLQTANKKVSDLTVIESKKVQACEALDLYR